MVAMAATLTADGEPGVQAKRRAETRAALLDATVESLATHGYAKTTTGRIAELAGLSRGAQLPYFRTRADLLTAAVAHLAEQRVAAFTASLGDEPASLEDCLDALWKGHQPPMFDATMELWVAARSDPKLRAHLLKIEGEVTAAIGRAADTALGEASRRPGFAEDLAYAFASIRGLAMLQVTHGTRSRLVAEGWRHMRGHLLKLIAEG
jgi:AcrR family transcriptional regulator